MARKNKKNQDGIFEENEKHIESASREIIDANSQDGSIGQPIYRGMRDTARERREAEKQIRQKMLNGEDFSNAVANTNKEYVSSLDGRFALGGERTDQDGISVWDKELARTSKRAIANNDNKVREATNMMADDLDSRTQRREQAERESAQRDTTLAGRAYGYALTHGGRLSKEWIAGLNDIYSGTNGRRYIDGFILPDVDGAGGGTFMLAGTEMVRDANGKTVEVAKSWTIDAATAAQYLAEVSPDFIKKFGRDIDMNRYGSFVDKFKHNLWNYEQAKRQAQWVQESFNREGSDDSAYATEFLLDDYRNDGIVPTNANRAYSDYRKNKVSVEAAIDKLESLGKDLPEDVKNKIKEAKTHISFYESKMQNGESLSDEETNKLANYASDLTKLIDGKEYDKAVKKRDEAHQAALNAKANAEKIEAEGAQRKADVEELKKMTETLEKMSSHFDVESDEYKNVLEIINGLTARLNNIEKPTPPEPAPDFNENSDAPVDPDNTDAFWDKAIAKTEAQFNLDIYKDVTADSSLGQKKAEIAAKIEKYRENKAKGIKPTEEEINEVNGSGETPSTDKWKNK